MTVTELMELSKRAQEEARRAAQDESRKVPGAYIGSPRDPFVQQLAGRKLEELRKHYTQQQIAEMFGVSRARVAQLCAQYLNEESKSA